MYVTVCCEYIHKKDESKLASRKSFAHFSALVHFDEDDVDKNTQILQLFEKGC